MDPDSQDNGEVEERSTRRSRRAPALGKLDPDVASAMVQRSAESERESVGATDGARSPIVVTPTDEGADRAIVDALAASLAKHRTGDAGDDDARRRFRRRRQVEPEAPGLPQLTVGEATAAVQPAKPADRVPQPRQGTDRTSPEPVRPDRPRHAEAAAPARSWRRRTEGDEPARPADNRARRLEASPPNLASAEHVALRRAAEAAATEQAAQRLVAEEAAVHAAEARLVAEEAALRHADAAAEALAARLEAEEATAHHITERQLADQVATEAAHGRAAAEESAREHAARAETESTHRAVAEGQAARAAQELRDVEERLRVALETATQHEQALATALEGRAAAELAAAEHARARAEAEESAGRLAVDRAAVEAAVRRHAELAEGALAARAAAEERALELAAALEATRELLLNETRSPRAWWQWARPVFVPDIGDAESAAPVAKARPAGGARRALPDGIRVPSATTPADGDETVTFRPRRGRALLSVVLAVAALAGAVYTAALAVQGDLLGVRGLVVTVVTILLIVGVSRTRAPSTSIWINRGVVHIAAGESNHRFDLNSPATQLEIVGSPESRSWRLLFLRRSLPPYVIDASVVDPVAFTAAVRRWRPEL